MIRLPFFLNTNYVKYRATGMATEKRALIIF